MRDHVVDPKAIVRLLASIPAVQADVLLTCVNAELGRRHIALNRALNLETDLFDLVHNCLSLDEGASALLNAVKTLYDGSPQVDDIGKLLSPAAPYLSPREERRIEELLRQCDIGDLAAMYRVATRGAGRGCPPGLADVWDVFFYLLDSNTRPGSLAPHLRLVALVVRDLVHTPTAAAPGLVVELRRWMYQQCDGLRESGDSAAAAELDRLLRQPPPHQTRDDFPITLIVRIEPVPTSDTERDLHTVSHWRQVDQVSWQPERGEDRNVPMSEVPATVAELIMKAEEDWGYGEGPLLLEFVLPVELINLEIDVWPLEEDDPTSPARLGSGYEVIIRSDTTLRPRHKHRPWHSRWDRFLRTDGTAHSIPLDGPVDLESLRAELRDTPNLVACVLSTPPDLEPGRSELQEAINAGLPIVLWCRDIGLNKDFRKAVADAIQPPKLKRLPASIKNLRCSGMPACRAVSLLWDDPHHALPSNRPLRTPTPR
ncbi:effector-associated domain 2-containing protein [Nonomuraea lactucae]|uniref:VMAP-C domain-containing protein n=1 Tax=Nonomuraea lactucae TaxID=2249762 RepID=UPI0013B3589D|nr:hypothetical protein [Nonomuraea lactucae]